MSQLKVLVAAMCFISQSAVAVTSARAQDAKPATAGDAGPSTKSASSDKARPSKEKIEAMLAKCSEEADAKHLYVTNGKGAARKAFRRECMHRMGVDPR